MKKMSLLLCFLIVSCFFGCAGAKPKIYVSELPKAKSIFIKVMTYKEFKYSKEEKKIIFNQESNEEFGIIFKEALEKELKKGFVIFNSLEAVEAPNNNILFIEISAIEKPPPIPFASNGFVLYTVQIKYSGKMIWQIEALSLTSSIIHTTNRVVRKRIAPELAKMIIRDFK
ncbi:hypothetical protein HZB04_04070 [Candidatus Wolfebacteria bacterium]|nr:hypothetical protein [Candidatus Wolfebacteria bacterium]